MNPTLELMTGRLSDLQIEDCWADFVNSMSTGTLRDLTAVGLAAAGLAGAATSTLYAEGGGVDQIQNFTGKIDGKAVAGRFSKVTFNNGDYLECAVEPQPDGTTAVYAARRPSDQTLWMFPHCSRGSDAHWRYARKMAVIVSLFIISGPLFAIAYLCDFDFKGNEFGFMASQLVVLSVIMGTVMSLGLAKKWMMFVGIAEDIFHVFGYDDPYGVDLEEENRQFWKANPHLRAERGFAPWVFRYQDPTSGDKPKSDQADTLPAVG